MIVFIYKYPIYKITIDALMASILILWNEVADCYLKGNTNIKYVIHVKNNNELIKIKKGTT
ncbi:hypothetical protein bcgnr5390_11510 [Bacillus luti]|nr:hypothetical protein BC2903_29400 [Bacillus cereus]